MLPWKPDFNFGMMRNTKSFLPGADSAKSVLVEFEFVEIQLSCFNNTWLENQIPRLLSTMVDGNSNEFEL